MLYQKTKLKLLKFKSSPLSPNLHFTRRQKVALSHSKRERSKHVVSARFWLKHTVSEVYGSFKLFKPNTKHSKQN